MRNWLHSILLCCVCLSAIGATLPPPSRVPVSVHLTDKVLSQSPGWHRMHADVIIGDRALQLICAVNLPHDRGSSQPPVVMTLHNRKSIGADGGDEPLLYEGLGYSLQTDVVDPRATGERPANPINLTTGSTFICLVPQCPPDCTWEMPGMARVLDQLISRALDAYGGDPTRVYLTGFSYGASSTWRVAEQLPRRFAAIAVLEGRATANPIQTISRLKDTGIWASAGTVDGDFTNETRRMHDALSAAGHTDHFYREIQGGNHFCYGSTYNDPNFWTWMFAHRSSRQPNPAQLFTSLPRE